jgi:hypothetical protein
MRVELQNSRCAIIETSFRYTPEKPYNTKYTSKFLSRLPDSNPNMTRRSAIAQQIPERLFGERTCKVLEQRLVEDRLLHQSPSPHHPAHSPPSEIN